MRDLKYLFAYTVPISVYISFISTGIWTYSAVVYVFLIIPLLDLILGEEKDNIPDESVASLQNKWIFDVMLFLNVPIVFGLLFVGFSSIQTGDFNTLETIGIAISTGVLLATNGINVAHELGHRRTYFAIYEQTPIYAVFVHAFLY